MSAVVGARWLPETGETADGGNPPQPSPSAMSAMSAMSALPPGLAELCRRLAACGLDAGGAPLIRPRKLAITPPDVLREHAPTGAESVPKPNLSLLPGPGSRLAFPPADIVD